VVSAARGRYDVYFVANPNPGIVICYCYLRRYRFILCGIYTKKEKKKIKPGGKTEVRGVQRSFVFHTRSTGPRTPPPSYKTTLAIYIYIYINNIHYKRIMSVCACMCVCVYKFIITIIIVIII